MYKCMYVCAYEFHVKWHQEIKHAAYSGLSAVALFVIFFNEANFLRKKLALSYKKNTKKSDKSKKAPSHVLKNHRCQHTPIPVIIKFSVSVVMHYKCNKRTRARHRLVGFLYQLRFTADVLMCFSVWSLWSSNIFFHQYILFFNLY